MFRFLTRSTTDRIPGMLLEAPTPSTAVAQTPGKSKTTFNELIRYLNRAIEIN